MEFKNNKLALVGVVVLGGLFYLAGNLLPLVLEKKFDQVGPEYFSVEATGTVIQEFPADAVHVQFVKKVQLANSQAEATQELEKFLGLFIEKLKEIPDLTVETGELNFTEEIEQIGSKFAYNYGAKQVVILHLTKVELLNDVIEIAKDHDLTNASSLRFSLEATKEKFDELRQQALAESRRSADRKGEELGLKIVRLTAVDEAQETSENWDLFYESGSLINEYDDFYPDEGSLKSKPGFVALKIKVNASYDAG